MVQGQGAENAAVVMREASKRSSNLIRTSNYIIYVPLEIQTESMLVHGYMGAIDIVCEEMAENLRNKRLSALDGSQLEVLMKRGYVTTRTPEEEQARVKSMAELFHKRASGVHSFLFLITYDCNFRCQYCFESSTSKGGAEWTGETFSRSLTDVVYGLVDKMDSQNSNKNRITLYGGEPLLKKNSPIVHYIVENGVKRGYKFCAITNGYELDSYRDILGEGAVDLLQITVDGGPEVHDRRRQHLSGVGSFYRIFDNICLALEMGSQVNLRVNLDEGNISAIHHLWIGISGGWKACAIP